MAAVGASAGGLEAITALLRNIPTATDLAVLVVQHLSRTAKSYLVELLSRSVSLRVVEGRNQLRIQPRHVYVIPSNARMRVADGRLSVIPSTEDSRATIDVLFQSVAEQYLERGVAVVLSGGGSDGSAGLAEVKSAGGFTFAQLPEEAKVDAMPRAAIATGLVDAVLGVAEIASELVRLSRHPLFRGEPTAKATDETGDQPHLRRIFQVLQRSSAIDFNLYKLPTIARRIQRRVALQRMNTLDEYADFLDQNDNEVAQLHGDLLIHVTSFFREPHTFEALRTDVFPRLLDDRPPGEAIRAWIPACSSGEEAYSLAIALVEFLGDKVSDIPIQIFGTDVSERVVERARAGVYPESIAGDVGAERLRRHFTKVDGGYRISKGLRERCVFARQDITRDPPFSRLDLVVCRNLLIYLSEPAQRKVVGLCHYALKPAGFLVLGRSETVGAQTDLFSAVDKRFKIYARKANGARPDVGFQSMAAPSAPSPAAASVPAADRPESGVEAEINRLLVDRYAPPGVLVDGQLRIVRARGRTSRFLELPSGDASLDIMKMVPHELVATLRSAFDHVRTRGVTTRREDLRYLAGGKSRTVNIEVTPVGPPDARHYLVIFDEPAAPAATPAAPGAGRGDKRRARKGGGTSARQVEEELAATREHLQAIIRELAAANEGLQSANEEILSSNEELQSTNEELDTAKEELQSTNEELNTLNDELEARNRELTQLNSDLSNLLTTVNIPVVIVSNELHIRRFTPAAERTLNLIPSDSGRPIGQIRPNFDCPGLEAMITEVVQTVSTREREVRDHDGRRYTLRIRPYKSLDNKIDGAVLTLFDMTDELALARATAGAIMSSVDDPVVLLDGELRIQLVNPAFAHVFRMSAAEAEGKSWQELGKRGWDLEALRELVEEVLPARRQVDLFAIDHLSEGDAAHQLLVDGRRLQGGTAGGTMVLLTVRRRSRRGREAAPS